MNREKISRGVGLVLVVGGVVWVGLTIWASVTTDDWDYLTSGIIGLVCSGFGWKRLFPGEPPPMDVDHADPLMDAAIGQARCDIRRFLDGLAAGALDSLVKYPIETNSGEVEHVWGAAHTLKGQDLIVSLLSDPVGDVVIESARQQVPLSAVEDWMLIDVDGRIQGGYTQIAMARIYLRDKRFVPYAIRRSLSDFVDVDQELLQ